MQLLDHKRRPDLCSMVLHEVRQFALDDDASGGGCCGWLDCLLSAKSGALLGVIVVFIYYYLYI